jgi:hypothetical protein
MKTREEIDNLKRCWHRDPCFDLSDYANDPEYAEYKDELIEFEKESIAKWDELHKKHREELASKYCPMSFSSNEDYGKCLLEKCAWWHPVQEKCAIAFLHSLNGFS